MKSFKKGNNRKDILLENLKKYENFLSKEVIDYLKSLIFGETTILKTELSDEQLNMLMTTKLFSDIVKYNLIIKNREIYIAKANELDVQDIFFIMTYPHDNEEIYLDKLELCLIPETDRFGKVLYKIPLFQYTKKLDNSHAPKLTIYLYNFVNDKGFINRVHMALQKEMQDAFLKQFQKEHGLTDNSFTYYGSQLDNSNFEGGKCLTKYYYPLNISINKIVEK